MARGEVSILINDQLHILCLTLGALAKIESGLNVNSIQEIAERLEQLSSQDLIVVLNALLVTSDGNPEPPDLSNAKIDLLQAASAIHQCFKLAFEQKS